MPNLKEVLLSIDPSFKEAPSEKQDLIINDLENNPDKLNQVFNHIDPAYSTAPQAKKFQIINDLTNRDLFPTLGTNFGIGAGETVTGAGKILKGAHGVIFGKDKPTPFFDALIQGGKDTSNYYQPKQPYARAVNDASIGASLAQEIPKIGATLPLQTMTMKPFSALADVGKFGGLTRAMAENLGAGLGYSGFKYGAGEYTPENVLEGMALDTITGGAFYGVLRSLQKVWDKLSPAAKQSVNEAEKAVNEGDFQAAVRHVEETLADKSVPFDAETFLKETKPAKLLPGNTAHAYGSNAMGGALAGGTLGGAEGAYEDVVQKKNLTLADYLKRIAAGAAIGAGLGSKYGGTEGSKAFVGGTKAFRGAKTGTHYSPHNFEVASTNNPNWGRSGGVETNNPADVRSNFFYKKGAKVETDKGIGKAGQYAYDNVDLSKFDLYDPATATKAEKAAFEKTLKEVQFNPMYAPTHDDRIKALQKLGYDGWENNDIVEVFKDVKMPKPTILQQSADFAGMPHRVKGMEPVAGAGIQAKPVVTLEATPSNTNPLYKDLVNATPAERLAFEKAHIEPVKRLAKKYGLDADVEVSLGAYEGQTNPMMAVEIKNAKFRDIGSGKFDIVQQEKIDNFAKEFGKATDQDAVAWYAPVYKGDQTGAHGSIAISEKLDATEWRALYDSLRSQTDAIVPVMHNGRIDFMNFEGLPEDKFNAIVLKALKGYNGNKITGAYLDKFNTVDNYIGKENYGSASQTGSGRSSNLSGFKSNSGTSKTFTDEVKGIQKDFSRRNATTFNSALEQQLKSLKQRKWQGKNLKGYLLKNGVTLDEMKYSGFDDYIAKHSKFNIDDLQKNLKPLELQTVTKRATPVINENSGYLGNKVVRDAFHSAKDKEDFIMILDNDEHAYNTLRKGDQDWDKTVHMIADDIYVTPTDAPKYQDYITKDAGGTNYREDLTIKNIAPDKNILRRIKTLRSEKTKLREQMLKADDDAFYKEKVLSEKLKKRRKIRAAMVEKDASLDTLNAFDKETIRIRDTEEAKIDKIDKDFKYQIGKLEEQISRLETKANEKNYKSPHYNEPNILYHTRTQDMNIKVKNPEWKNPADVKGNFDDFYELRDKGTSYKVVNKKTGEEYVASYPKKILEENNMSPEDLKKYLMEKTELGTNSPAVKQAKAIPKYKNEKTLHAEELQSDWHQAGREVGYKEEVLAKRQELDKLYADGKISYDQFTNELKKINQAVIPQAPYSKTWHEKAMKDLIARAVKGDYDRVSWTTGRTQAERYNIAKQIDELYWNKNTGEVQGFNDGDQVFFKVAKDEKELAGIVGRDVAHKIATQASSNGEVTLKGLDLDIGNKGMSGFYDKMLPNWTNKYIKKFGSKVELKKLDDGTDVWSFKVTNKMKHDIGNKGQFLYAHGMGLAAGVEEDDEGNISYNITKGLAGVAGTYATMRLVTALAKAYEKGKVSNKLVEGLNPESKLQLFQRVMQDRFNRVKQLINTKANIKTIADKLNIYQKEELYHGRVADQIQKFEKDVYVPLIEKIRNSNLTIEEVDKYLHARHAIERNRRMFELNGIENGSGMSDAEAKAIIAKYAHNKAINNIAKDVYKINRNRLKMIRDNGLESDEFITQLENSYDNYVPLKRKFEEGATFTGARVGKGYDIKGREFKRAKGSHREVESPLLNSILDYQETIIRSEKNKVGKSLLDFIEQYPDKSLYEVQTLKYMPQYDSKGVLQSINPKYKPVDNVMHVKVNGKIKEITFHDPALAAAMKNLNAEQINALLGYAQKAVRFLAGVNTQWNPAFTLSNFQRDIQTGFLNMPAEVKVNRLRVFKDVLSAMRGVYRSERGKALQNNQWSKLYQEMKTEGGTTGWLDQYDVPTLAKDVKKIMDKNYKKAIPRKVFDSFFKLIDDANTAVENSTRLVAYKMARDSGLSKEKSAAIAKNLTVNFNRKGEWGTTMNTAYMFYNASIQGSVRMAEALKNPTTQKFVAGLMASSVGLYYYNISQNKEAYDQIPEYVKDTNYIFMNKDGKYQTIRVPYGFNIFKTAGDIIAEASNGDIEGKTLPARFLKSAASAFNPIGAAPTTTQGLTPTLLRPIADIELNKNFIGSRIAPEGNPYAPKSTPDAYNSFKSVNPTLKKIAIKLNSATGGNRNESGLVDISPETMEYMINFATGGVGKLLNRSYTTLNKVAKGEKVETHNIPFYRQFQHEPREKQALYNARDLYSKSGVNRLSVRDRHNFRVWIEKAVKNKTIGVKKAFQMRKNFNANQALLDFTHKYKIESYQQIRDNKKLLGKAIQMGITKNQLKKFLTKD